MDKLLHLRSNITPFFPYNSDVGFKNFGREFLKERKNTRKKIQSLLYLRQSDYAGGTVEKLNEDSKYPLFYKGFTYM